MKQIRLFMAMMLCVMSIGAWAATDKFACNATPFTTASNASYSNGTFSWTAGNSNSMPILKNLKGNVDLSNYKYLVVKTHERNADFRIIIYCDNNGSTSSYIGVFQTDEIQLDLTQITLTTSGHTYANINNIHIAGNGNSGSLKIAPEDIYLETESYEMMSFSTTINNQSDVNTPFGWYKLNESSVLEKRGQAVTNGLGTTSPANSIIFGYNSNTYSESTTGYMDLTGYSKVTVELNAYDGTKNGQVRLLNAENSNHQAINGFSADKLSVTADLAVTKCATIKPGQGASSCQDIKGITFAGSFIPEHTTAWTFPHDVSNTKVVYDRTFTPNQWATICVPFNMSAADAATVGEFYELVSFANGVLGFKRVDEVHAYVPYLINPTAITPMATLGNRTLRAYATPEVTVDDVTFCGTMEYTSNLTKSGFDLYGYDAANGEFVKVGDGVSVKAFRAYIAIPTFAGVSPRLRVTTGTSVATGLDNVQTTEEPVYYNIMGQRVSRDTKGVVICNGKKFINM